jgi:hypothetical protein
VIILQSQLNQKTDQVLKLVVPVLVRKS